MLARCPPGLRVAWTLALAIATLDSGREPVDAQDPPPEPCSAAEPGSGFTEGVEVGVSAPWAIEFYGLIATDLGGDGRKELVLCDRGARKICILEGEIPGAPLVRWHDAGYDSFALSLAAGDLNGDGRSDVVVGHWRGEVTVLLQDHQSGFAAGEELGPSDLIARELAIADLNGDGRPDVAAMSEQPPSILVFFGDGSAHFSTPRSLEVSKPPGGLATGDLDDDGIDDVATVAVGEIRWFRSRGDGTFETRSVEYPGGEQGPLRLADLDGDGATDFAVVTWGGVAVLWGGAAGDPGSQSDLVTVGQTTDLQVEDLDGDGLIDVLVRRTLELFGAKDHRVEVWRQRSHRSFVRVGDLEVSERFGMAVADLDGDGHLELCTSNRSSVSILRGTGRLGGDDCDGDGVVDSCQLPDGDCDGNEVLDRCENAAGGLRFEAAAVAFPGAGVAAGDLDGDGGTDLAVGVEGDGVRILANLGGARFRAAGTVEGFAPGYPAGEPLLADLDRDGDADLIVPVLPMDDREPHQIRLFANSGAGEFAARGIPTIPRGLRDVAAADLDSDGDPDLVCVNSTTRRAYVLSNDGSGAFSEPVEIDTVLATKEIVAADMDGDADPDLVLSGTHADILVFLQEPGGSFTEPRITATPGACSSLIAGDLDADGDLDLAAVAPFGDVGGSRWFRNLGDGDLEMSENLAPLGGPLAVVASDVDQDLDLDLGLLLDRRMGPFQPGQIQWLRNDGAGEFKPAGTFQLPGVPRFLAMADLDGSGGPDGVYDGSGIWVLRNLTPDATTTDCDANGVLDRCEIASGAATDSDGDGLLDACDTPLFRRGDPNADGTIDITDGIFLLGSLFLDAGPPTCLDAADANGDDLLNVSDPIAIFQFLFLGGAPPPPPNTCGREPLAPGESSSLGCVEFAGC